MSNKMIIGLKKIAGASRRLGRDCHLQINYDMVTKRAWYNECTNNNWVEYEDEDILCCGCVSTQTTMLEIHDMILEALFLEERDREIEREYSALLATVYEE